MNDVTAEEVQRAAQDAELGWVPLRECSICRSPIGYEIAGDRVFWNGACDCSSAFGPEERGWQDIADLINMQSQDKHRGDLMKKFGIHSTPSPTEAAAKGE